MHGHHDRNDFTDYQDITDLIYLLLTDVVQYLNFKYTVQHITLYYTMGMLCDCISHVNEHPKVKVKFMSMP
jgi:hypothetical protein